MILLLGGTSDALNIAEALSHADIPFLMTVTSDYGALCADQYSAHIWRGFLNESTFLDLMALYGFKGIVDATHPHAYMISMEAQQWAKAVSIDYLRYERLAVDAEFFDAYSRDGDVYTVSTVEEAAQVARVLGQKIMVTGSKHIQEYVHYLKGCELYARIIPSPEVVADVIRAGISPKRVIAMHGPFGEALNHAMFKALELQVLITKESGTIGGFEEKLNAAKSCGMKTVVVRRPRVHFERVYVTVDSLILDLQAYGVLGESYKGAKDD